MPPATSPFCRGAARQSSRSRKLFLSRREIKRSKKSERELERCHSLFFFSKRRENRKPLESSAAMGRVDHETDAAEDWPPTPRARRAPPVTTLHDLPPEMLTEVARRVEDARALASGA